ncbi:unnamed protein product [Rotaria socialis]
MNNTASTSIMLPVALAVIHELGICSENSLNRQQTAVINVVFDSTNGEGSDENKTEELTHTTQICQTLHISDGTTTIFCGILPLILPDSNPFNRSAFWYPSSAFLIFPCTLAVSLASMLPIATPPNAIVFASGAIRVIDMIETGIVMNLIGFFVIFIAANT